VGLARLNPRGLQPVVIEHPAEPRGELPSTAPLQFMRRGRQIVVSDHGRHRAQRPHGALQAGDKRFEGLTRGEAHVGPAAEAEDPLKQEVREGLALDRHAQLTGIGEVEGALTARHSGLLEVDLLVRAVLRAPIPHPPLQRPQLPGRKPPGIAVTQPLEQGQGLEPSIRIRR